MWFNCKEVSRRELESKSNTDLGEQEKVPLGLKRKEKILLAECSNAIR